MCELNVTDPVNFGRVFIRSKDGEWELLESARFSKLDFRIYSEDRATLHPDFLDLVGRRVSVGFKIRNPDLLNGGEKKEHEGRFRLSIRLGDNPAPDLEHLKEAFELEMDMFRDLNLVSNERAEELIADTLMCAYWIFCMPGRPIMQQHLIHKTIPFTNVDDSMEDYGKEFVSDHDEKIRFPYRTLSTMASMVISGGFKSSTGGMMEAFDQLFGESKIPMSKLLEFFGLGKKILNAVVALRESAVETGERHGISAESFLKPFRKAVMSVCVELCEEWKAKDHASVISAITKIHGDTTFGIISCEGVALQCGIGVSDHIRENPLFLIFIDLIGQYYQKVNDIFSYAREAEVEGNAGKATNEICLLHLGKGWPIEKAVKKLEDDANEVIEQLVNVGELLLKMYPKQKNNSDHENLKAFIRMVKEVLTGYLQWYAFIKRYHPGMAYDCYID